MLRLQCLLRPTVWLYAWLSWQLLGNVLVRQQSVTLRMLTAVAVACLAFETVRLLNDKLRRHLCHVLAGYATVVACAGWLQAEGRWEDLLPSNPGVWGAWAGIGFLVVVTQLNRQQGSKMLEGLWGLSLLALLIASHSRASWLGTLAGLLAWLAGGGQLVRIVKGRRWLVLPVLLGGILCGIGLYQFKPDSAKGRWLIWKAAMPLVQEHPLTGLGADAFRRQYLYAQADYFRQHPGTPEALYADNVVYAYNEPFKVLIEQGLIGLLLSVGLFLSCLLRRRQTSADRLWRSLLLLWGVVRPVCLSLQCSKSVRVVFPAGWCLVRRCDGSRSQTALCPDGCVPCSGSRHRLGDRPVSGPSAAAANGNTGKGRPRCPEDISRPVRRIHPPVP